MKPLAILPFALALTLTAPARAQSEHQKPAQAEKCMAQPDDQRNSPNGTLDDCDGVFKPPATGDQEMTAPPPDEGKTPIIKPGQVPPQPPKR